MVKSYRRSIKTSVFLASFLIGTGFFGVSIATADNDFSSSGFSFKDDSTIKGQTLEQDPFGYRAPSMKFKGFALQGDISVTDTYNTNIRAEKNDGDSDFITTIAPRLKIEKELSRHSVFLDANAEIRRAAEYSDENTEDYSVTLGANLEAFHNLHIPLHASIGKAHTDRTTTITSFKTKTPLRTDTQKIGSGFIYEPNRLKISGSVDYTEKRKEDNTRLDTGAVAIYKDGEADTTSYGLKLSYKLEPNLQPFINAKYENQEYLRGRYQNGSFSGIKKDNIYTQYLIGTAFNYKGLIYGSVGVGFDKREYDDASLESATKASYSGDITWEFSRKSRFNLAFSQQNVQDNETTVGYDNTEIDLKYAYELQQDLYLQASAGYALKEFSSTNRTDDDYSGGLEIKYFLSPRLQLGAEYLYLDRQSTEQDNGFDQSQIMLRLTGAL